MGASRSAKIASPPKIEGKPVRTVLVTDLLLDPQNPRLRLPQNPSQKTVLLQLYEEHRLEELMASFVQNSFFDEEPLVVVPATNKPGKFVVVEGNRRLAALKLLTDPTIAAEIRFRDPPPASEEQLERLREVPVKEYERREEVLPYLGFRHITGIKEWGADSKARYIYQLKHDSGKDLREIATSIGDTFNFTERLYLGWSLIKQAEKDTGFTEKDTYKFPFSYMYDAVRKPEVREFLGLKADDYTVTPSHRNDLKDLTGWLFGSKAKKQEPIVDRKAQLDQLGTVLGDREGVKALRAGESLEDAYQRTAGEEQELIKLLTIASRNLDRAKGFIHRHSSSKTISHLVKAVQSNHFLDAPGHRRVKLLEPSTSSIDALCDWAEVRAMRTPRQDCTKGEIQQYVKVDDYEPDEFADDDYELKDSEKDERIATEVIEHARERQRLLGDHYPFSVTDSRIRAINIRNQKRANQNRARSLPLSSPTRYT